MNESYAKDEMKWKNQKIVNKTLKKSSSADTIEVQFIKNVVKIGRAHV